MRWVAENIFKHTPKQAIAFYPYTENLINVRSRSPLLTSAESWVNRPVLTWKSLSVLTRLLGYLR